MPAQYVRPYVKTNKSDYIDAGAIAPGVGRPNMPFVPIQTDELRDLQSLHRVRSVAQQSSTRPTKAEYTCADHPVTVIFRLRQSGGLCILFADDTVVERIVAAQDPDSLRPARTQCSVSIDKHYASGPPLDAARIAGL
jgi:hypothetical protein